MIVEFLVGAGQQHILLNIRPSSFSVAIDLSTIYNYDGAGRLLGAYCHGRNYLRGLDNRILVKWGAGHGLAHRLRMDLDTAGKRAFLGEMVERMTDLASALRSGQARAKSELPAATCSAAAETLSSVLGCKALEADAERFRAVYKPISILPPDQYLALVLQATEGCSWNKCTFCDFYRDRPFRIKAASEFKQHVHQAIDFFGPALALRRSVFLADANALVIPQERLLRLLDIANAELPIVPSALKGDERRQWLTEHPRALHGIYSFVDAFTTRHKTEADYRQMAERNLRRVYIGLESGDDELLAFLHKGSSAADATQAVAAIKAGGVDVGVIVMLGVGGERFAARHVGRTAAALNAMQLGERDIIYFSPFMDFAGSEYGEGAARMGILPMSASEMDAQMASMRAELRFASAQHAPKIAVYDIREFIY
jgi:hypothetical protein